MLSLVFHNSAVVVHELTKYFEDKSQIMSK
jgi:hypothetical protein